MRSILPPSPPASAPPRSSPSASHMTGLPEITRLFTKLASTLRRPNAANDGAAAASSLTESLNETTPRVRVLDAALSLMCFANPEVYRARIECLVRTIVSILSSSVACKILQLSEGGEEVLMVGSSITNRDCDELLRVGADVLESLEGHGGFSGLYRILLHAVLKAVGSSSRYQGAFLMSSILYEGSEEPRIDRTIAISKLMHFLPEESFVNNHEMPLKLILWYLQPLILKHEISEILRETVQRPFLCLKKELHDRSAWRLIIICLVTSPTIFLETRALLHNWLLLTGLAPVLDLQAAIVSSMLDLLSAPMRWGVPMELGLKFPFLHAYFSREHRKLLAMLTERISCGSFMELVHHIRTLVSPANICLESISPPCLDGTVNDEVFVNTIQHNSTWAMLMNFPAWFYFASALIFYQKTSEVYSLSNIVDTVAINYEELYKAAAEYITWVLTPIDGVHHLLLPEFIKEISRSWTTKSRSNCQHEQRSCSDICQKNTVPCSRKLKITKTTGYMEPAMIVTNDTRFGIILWLQEFRDRYVNFYNGKDNSHVIADEIKSANLLKKSLLLRIPLGILVLCPNYLDENGCELLLHFAATSEILQSEDLQGKNKDSLFDDNPTSCSARQQREWVVNGACLVFNLFDMIEDILSSAECEDMKIKFICQMKGKVGKYLLRCVRTLLDLHREQFETNEVLEADALLDLYRRLLKWRKEGGEVFEGNKAINDVLDDLSRRFTVSFEPDIAG